MNDHDTEDRLRKAALPALPAEWKDDILSAAMDSQPSSEDRPSLWRELLWPSPKAWGALAGAWVLVGLLCGLHLQRFDDGAALADHRPDPAELRHSLEQRQALLAQLAGASPPDTSDREPPPAVGPRTETHMEWGQA